MKFVFKHIFEKPGSLHERLHPLREAGDTFLRTPSDVTSSAPHVRDVMDQKRLMIFVIYALFPSLLFGIWNTGHQFFLANQINASFADELLKGAACVFPILFVSYLVGGLWEVLFAVVRRHAINEGFLVTGMLFALILPPAIPLWQVALGISFGVVIGKEVFGGVGYNILNPALTGRAFLFFAYPKWMVGNAIWVAGANSQCVDGVTQATPLSIAFSPEQGVNTARALGAAGYSLWNMTLGTIPGCIGSTSTIAIGLGMVFLLITGIASWRIICGGLLGCIATGAFLNACSVETCATVPVFYHLVMGGFLFGLVFMATDPVSAASTSVGKWIYGGLIGVLTVLIRVSNPAYPDGTMLAILFMNVMAPLIDHFVVQAHIKKRTARARALNHV